MPDIELLTDLDRELLAAGILDVDLVDEYAIVHEKIRQFRNIMGDRFSTDTLSDGEAYLRQWLNELFLSGAPLHTLTSYLRCGLAHLCHDFIEFTYEEIDGDELTSRSYRSFVNRNYHQSVFIRPKKQDKKKKTSKKAVKKNNQSYKSGKKPLKKRGPSKKGPKKFI